MNADDRLHSRRAHPDFEYDMTTCARKQESHPPPGDGWEPNAVDGDPHSAWERCEYHERHYWRRRKRWKAGVGVQTIGPYPDELGALAATLAEAAEQQMRAANLTPAGPTLWRWQPPDGSLGPALIVEIPFSSRLVQRAFTDPISRTTVSLVLAGDEPSLWDGTVGIRHDGCDRLADVSPGLDAFYCQACRRSGRVSGAWVVDVMDGRA